MILIETKEALLRLTEELAAHEPKRIALDFETTGLNPYRGDKPFLLALATSAEEYVIPIHYPRETGKLLKQILKDEDYSVRGFNIKFDLHFCISYFGIKPSDIKARLVDAQVLARLYKNDALSLSLDEVASWFGHKKDPAVMGFIKANKCYKLDHSGEKVPDFTMVPAPLLNAYAAKDARLHYNLVDALNAKLMDLNNYLITLAGDKNIKTLISLESEVTKVLLGMEAEGVLLDETYTEAARSFETSRAREFEHKYTQITGTDFVDSAKALTGVFAKYPDILERIPLTEKGNRSFTDEVLAGIEHPIAECVRGFREAHKKAGTYYENFKALRGFDGRIHTNFRQPGTQTGRLSCSNPNLQNVPKEDDSEYKARACFVVPPGYKWLSIDYQAQEFRLLLDHAEELGVIQEVLAGKDVHQATADLVGCSRREAKTINFGLLYGMGSDKLAGALGISRFEADNIKRKYFRELPKICSFIEAIVKKAESGKVSNWVGRVYNFNRDYSYKAVNYVIQGGCSDIMRVALVRLQRYVNDNALDSKIVLSVHDEVCFYLKDGEETHIPKFQAIMTGAYQHRYLPLVTEASISATGWGHTEKWHG